jgi:site-specific recombinase
MQQQLEQPQAVLDDHFIELVERIRPIDASKMKSIKNSRLFKLYSSLPMPHRPYKALLLRLISQYKQTSLYADSGILSLDGFWNQLSQRLGHISPLINDEINCNI